ncbi:MAG: PP0621 family protein [Campylobacterota bacterium]|nr:PP0621 family protein [Campylobacterota bacterium]
MIKYLLVIAVIAAVYFFFIKKKSVKKPSEPNRKSTRKLDDEDMVECAKCNTYVRVDEAFIKNGQYFCSQECMNS